MITRAPRPTSNFYLLDKAISENKRIGWAARGMLIFLLGKPDSWTVSPTALVNETAEAFRSTGRDGVYAALKELKDAGYLRTIGSRNDGGAFSGSDYIVSETPYTAFPDAVDLPYTAFPDAASKETPHTGLPDTANPTQVSIDSKQGLKEEKKGLNSAEAPAIVNPDSSIVKPEEVPQEVWADFLILRKEKRAKLTKTALAGIKREADKAGLTMAEAITACCENNWQGFNAGWYAERTTKKPSTGITTPRQEESFAERDARNARENWERMTNQKWPENELPNHARPLVIDIAATQDQRIA